MLIVIIMCRTLTLTRSFHAPQSGSRHEAGKENSLHQTLHADGVCDSVRNKETSPVDTDGEQGSVGEPSGILKSEACVQGIEFLQNLKNPSSLQPVSLPLQLKLFARIPVVISARLFGQTGKPSETFAHLLIK